jgi:hypothetical protein
VVFIERYLLIPEVQDLWVPPEVLNVVIMIAYSLYFCECTISFTLSSTSDFLPSWCNSLVMTFNFFIFDLLSFYFFIISPSFQFPCWISHACCWVSHPGLELLFLFHLAVWILFEVDSFLKYNFEFFAWYFKYFSIFGYWGGMRFWKSHVALLLLFLCCNLCISWGGYLFQFFLFYFMVSFLVSSLLMES